MIYRRFPRCLSALIYGLALCFVATILSACDVQQGDHVVWSPDEKTMALLAGDGLHLGDLDGKLSPVIAPDIEFFKWLPDAKHAVIVQSKSLSSWSDLELRLTPLERASVIQESKSLRAAVMSIKQSIEELDNTKELSLQYHDEDIVFLVSTDPEFKTKYLRLMKKATGSDVTPSISAQVHLVKLVAVSWTSLISDQQLFYSRKGIKEIRVAPDGKMVAIVTEIDRAFDRFRIAVLSFATKDTEVVTEAGSGYPDWSADSQSLLYCQKILADSEEKLPSIGVLSKTRVCDDTGHVLRDKQSTQQLAIVSYASENRVRNTFDDRIFFSCPKLKLPSTRPQPSETQGLFALDRSRYYSTIALIDQPDNNLVCQAFESSRDGRYIAIPERNGATHLLSVLTGEMEEIQSGPTWGRLIVCPAFRSNNELTCVRQIGDSENTATAGLVLWNIKDAEGRDLSANWPASFKKQWQHDSGKSSSIF